MSYTVPEFEIKWNRFLCRWFGHDYYPWISKIHNKDGSVAYEARCCRRDGCWHREPTTEAGRRMMESDRARAKLGLKPHDFFV
jgi:hypothetical protein